MSELAFNIACNGAPLPAIMHQANGVRGVLILVGGPQYRVGSHRQFVLLARALAKNGVPVLRFDMRGMGDQIDPILDFESHQPDVLSAIDAFFKMAPQLQNVVLWGLCDGASLAAMVATQDARVDGVILINPWVRTEQSLAKARLKFYYLERLKNPEFWRKLFSGKLVLGAAWDSLVQSVRGVQGKSVSTMDLSLPERMLQELEKFRGRICVILSLRDLTAQEFIATVAGSKRWRETLSRGLRFEHPDANHTFARESWRDQVAQWTLLALRDSP